MNRNITKITAAIALMSAATLAFGQERPADIVTSTAAETLRSPRRRTASCCSSTTRSA